MPIDARDMLGSFLAERRDDWHPHVEAVPKEEAKLAALCEKCPSTEAAGPVLRRTLAPDGRHAEWRVAWLCAQCARLRYAFRRMNSDGVTGRAC
jgi:hypothetical protein